MLPVRLAVGGATGNAWANPRPAETPHRLVLSGGFRVDGSRDRRRMERARVLGFEDLGAYLQDRCDAGASIPRIASELGVSDWQMQAALARLQVRLAPRPQRLAAQRRRYTEERIAARVAQLGFADVEAYLVNRVVEQAWLLAEVAAELAAHRLTVRRCWSATGSAGCGARQDSGRRPRRGAGCSWWGGRRGGRRGWRSSASRIWPATCGHGRWSRGGRSSECGPSFGLAAGGWWGSWPGWGCDPDLGSTVRPPGAGERRAAAPLRHGLVLGVLAGFTGSGGLPSGWSSASQ